MKPAFDHALQRIWKSASGFLLALLLVPRLAIATEPMSPLVGTWVLCQDPDGGAKDVLEFYAEGYGFSIGPNKPKVPFLFKEAAGQVLLAANSRGNIVTIYLKVDQDYRRLTASSERTGNDSFYVRQGQEAENNCTAK